MVTAQGVGGLVGGLLIGPVGRRVSPAALIGLGLWTAGAALLVLYNLPRLPLALPLIAVAGATFLGFAVSAQTLLQQRTDDRYRGRVFGALGTTNGLVSLGGFTLGGLLGELGGIVPVLNGSAGLRLAAGVLAVALLRGARGSRPRDGHHPAAETG